MEIRRLKNYIAGNWIDSQSGRETRDLNPADTNETLCIAPSSTKEDAALAVAAAAEAFPGWKSTPAPVRGKILFHAMNLLAEKLEEVAETLTREEGKTLRDSRGEVQRAINILEFTAGEGRRLRGATIPSELPNTFIYTVRQPLGVVGLITPWNFPVAIPVWKIAPAILSGNTVVFKPAEWTPFTAVKIVEIFEKAGVPPGVLNLVFGSGSIVGDAIVSHPEVCAVSFTGSNEVGGALYEKCSQRGARVQCEMGGKNPLIVLNDADLELAVEGAVQGGFGSTGQRCTASSRVIVQKGIADRFVEKLQQRMGRIRVGNGLDPETDMGPLVDEKQLRTVSQYIETGVEEGARLISGGRRLNGSKFDHGWFLEPTLFDDVRPEMRISQEEIFGPVVSIIRVNSFEDALAIANDVKFGLCASLYTQDNNRILKFVDSIEAGKVHINSPTIGGEAQAPFGGIKATGIGPREQGTEVFEFYTEIKTVYMDYTGRKRETSIY